MTKRDLMLVLAQYEDNALVFVELGIGTMHRVSDCQLTASKHDDSLYEVKSAEKDKNTPSLVLKVE